MTDPGGAAESYFVSGAGGFVGRRVLDQLLRQPGVRVAALLRSGPAPVGHDPGRLHVVRGDLLEPDTYRAAISPGCVVLHLGGATGKRRRAEFFRANVDGTRRLLAAATAAGASHFVHVSSIAARYADSTSYPYGQSKREAEAIVRQSGVPFTILRPTLVFGVGSPIQAALTRLALLPRALLFGDGTVRTQPVHVSDVADVVVRAGTDRWVREEVDVGGPDTVTLDELMARIREARGRPSRAPIHLPLRLTRNVLALLEPVLLPVLPFTAGQLAMFGNSSCATPHRRMEALAARLTTLSAMIAPGAR